MKKNPHRVWTSSLKPASVSSAPQLLLRAMPRSRIHVSEFSGAWCLAVRIDSVVICMTSLLSVRMCSLPDVMPSCFVVLFDRAFVLCCLAFLLSIQ